MHATSDNAVPQQSLVTHSIATYRAGKTVLSAASSTGRLLIRKEGAVTVVKDGVEIARVTKLGAGFGEFSARLGQPHTTDVHAPESKFHVVSTAAPLMQDPVALPYVATVVERPEDSANRAQAELKRQDGQLSSITRKTIDKIEELLGASGGNLAYAGYPYDPFVLDT